MRLTGLKIVLVDDHEGLRTQIGSFLEQFGANVILAADGVQGLKAIRSRTRLVAAIVVRMTTSVRERCRLPQAPLAQDQS